MTRPLRVDVGDGWYHVMSRGIEQRAVLPDESYYRHFLKLLGRMTDRYAVEVHAWVLIGNHNHILRRTPEANCSQAVQWLNVSYSVWFNRKRQGDWRTCWRLGVQDGGPVDSTVQAKIEERQIDAQKKHI